MRTVLVTVAAVVLTGLGPAPGWAQTAPVAYNGSVAAVAGSSAEVTLDAYDEDADAVTFAVVAGPQHGTLSDDCSDGVCTYTPADGFTGSDSLVFTASDGSATSDQATVSIEVEATPTIPTAYDQALGTQKDVPVDVELYAEDPNGDPLTYAVVDPPAHGTLSGDCSDGTCTYTPETGFSGDDNFTYTASDGTSSSNTATVSIEVAKSPSVTRLQVAGAGANGASLTWTNPVGVTGIVVRYSAGDAPATPSEGTDVPVSGTPARVTVTGLTTGTEYGFSVFALNGADASDPTATSFTPFACPDLAAALDGGALVTGGSWVACSADDANGVASPQIPYFSARGAGMALLTSGDRLVAEPPSDDGGEGRNNRSGQRGAQDVSTYRVDLQAPSSGGCLRFDYVFGSEEFPEYVGTEFNDGFLAQLDTDDWRVDSSVIVAPGNFARTADGGYVSVNGPIFDTTKNKVFDPLESNTGYDGASATLTASTPITGGVHRMYLTVFDAGDGVLDTGVFVDNLRIKPGSCDAGTTVNTPPTATDDVATSAGAQVSVDVLANDTDPEGQTLTVTTAAPTAAHGTVTCSSTACSYTPTTGYTGSDTFDYTVSDGAGGTDTGTVAVTVTGNRPPVAGDDLLTTAEDTSGSVTVRGNDTDPDGDTVTVSGSGNSAHGSFSCSAATCSYTPAANYHGSDSFDYTVSDGNGGTDTGTVVVTVTAVNDAPVAAADTATTTEDTAKAIAVVANDQDADGQPLSAVLVDVPAHGQVTCSAGTCTYTPAANYAGSDSFTYRASDGATNSAVTTVSVTVTPVNDAPVAVDDTGSTSSGGTTSVPVRANDTDADGDTLTVSGSGQSAHGSYSCSAGACSYTAAPGWSGPDGFDYTVSDGHGGSDTGHVTVSVAAVNSPPVVKADILTTAEDTAAQVAVLGNDTDADGDTLTVTGKTNPAHGTVTCTTACTYAPAANWSGTDSFTYTASDGKASSTATVTVTVTPVNDLPVAGDDSASSSGQPAKVSVLLNDQDVDQDALTVTTSTNGAKGTVTCGSSGACTYTPSAGFVGVDTFTYTVSDGHGGTDTATVRVTVSAAQCLPATPKIGLASPGAKGGQLTAVARWKAGTKPCAAPTTGYVVTAYKLSSKGKVLYTRTFTAGASATSLQVKLPSSLRWAFRVAAVNSVGTGASSARSNVVNAR